MSFPTKSSGVGLPSQSRDTQENSLVAAGNAAFNALIPEKQERTLNAFRRVAEEWRRAKSEGSIPPCPGPDVWEALSMYDKEASEYRFAIQKGMIPLSSNPDNTKRS